MDKKYNYGVALLRMLMCFEVVLIHFWTDPGNSRILTPFVMLKETAIPVFMFLSFYFSRATFLSTDFRKKAKRVWRVVYPLVAWAFVYWFAAILVLREYSVSNLLWQIITGHSPKLNPTMWFQSVLLVLTLFYFLLFRYLKDKWGLIVLWTIALLSLGFQYSGYNALLFDSLRFELKYPLGRLFEMIPYSALGFSIAYYDVFNKLTKKRVLFLLLFGVAALVLSLLNRYFPTAPGFGYSKASNLVLAFLYAGFAFLLPFDRIPEKIRNIIRFVTKYTLGVYCMHRLIGAFYEKVVSPKGFEINGFLLCIIVYALAFGVSFLLSKLSQKYLNPLVD